jgi:hypothetical protein
MTGIVDAGNEKGRADIHHFFRKGTFATASIDSYKFLKKQKNQLIVGRQNYKKLFWWWLTVI